MWVLPNWLYRFNAIPVSYFVEIDRLILQFTWRCKGPRVATTILKNGKVEGLTLLDFETYYKATVIETVWHQRKNRHINWPDKEPGNRPPYAQSTDSWQSCNGNKMEQRYSIQQMLLEQLTIHVQNIHVDTELTHVTKIE